MATNPPASVREQQLLSKQVYDLLMADIEPDLLLKNIPLLDEKYRAETPAEHAERLERYQIAYTKFDQSFNEFSVKIGGSVRSMKRDALKQKEKQATNEESQAIEGLTKNFL